MNPSRLLGSAPSGAFTFHSNQSAKNNSSGAAIFPIVKQEADGTILVIGTGFFIAPGGIFVTAKHVLMDVMDESGQKQKKPIGMFHLLADGKTYYHRPILRAWQHDTADLSVGQVTPMKHKETKENIPNDSVILGLRIPENGENLVTYAYPGVVHDVQEGLPTITLRPDFFDGKVVQFFPKGRDSILLPFPVIQTNIHIHGGASGGPVFDEKGRAIALNCMSSSPDTNYSFVVPLTLLANMQFGEARFEDEKERRVVPFQELIEKRLVRLG